MHNKIGYYYLLILLLCAFNFFKVNSYSLPLKGKTIYIDPGHGGVDCGTKYKDILEKDINLELSYLLKHSLENKGAKVYMTRYDDYDLSSIGASRRKKSDFDNRIKLINNSDADMYISIHLNYIDSSRWSGVQIFYDDINSNNNKLASSIQNMFNNNRKISIIKDKYMYKRINKVGVLAELGFLSNSTDRSILLDDKKRDDVINKVTEGIINYYKDNLTK